MHKRAYKIQAESYVDSRATLTIALEYDVLREFAPISASVFAQGLCLVLGKGAAGSVIAKPTGIFKGLERRLHCPDNPGWYDADNVYVYVSKPGQDYMISSGQAVAAIPPKDSVFITYLRFFDSGGQNYTDVDTGTSFLAYGVVANWEWALCDKNDTHLPKEYSNRYPKRIK